RLGRLRVGLDLDDCGELMASRSENHFVGPAGITSRKDESFIKVLDRDVPRIDRMSVHLWAESGEGENGPSVRSDDTRREGHSLPDGDLDRRGLTRVRNVHTCLTVRVEGPSLRLVRHELGANVFVRCLDHEMSLAR